MVLAEKNDNPRNGRRSRGPSPNGHAQADSTSEDEGTVPVDKIRVGRDFQATCPELHPEAQRRPELLADRALLVWSPTDSIPDTELEDYIELARTKYGYNGEQALGMLFWHKHDLTRASLDLANFTPFPDEWSVEDKVLFEQAFQFHGKSFHRIRQMLPDKSIASLVKYYYGWKKTRSRTSLMDKQARKLNSTKEDGEDGDERGSNEDFDHDEKRWTFHRGINRKSGTSSRAGQPGRDSATQGEGTCANCGVFCSVTHRSPKGHLCNSCYQHWRRTGSARPTSGPMSGKRGGGGLMMGPRARGRPPKGIHINHDDLATMASGNAGTVLLKSMDRELESLRRQIQQNKQSISSLKRKHPDSIDDLRVNDDKQRNNPRWSTDEASLAVEGFRKYGKDYKAIAEMLGNKTEHYVRSFYMNYRKKYNLDQLIKECERENGATNGENGVTNGDDNDDVICLSPSPPSKKDTLKNSAKTKATV